MNLPVTLTLVQILSCLGFLAWTIWTTRKRLTREDTGTTPTVTEVDSTVKAVASVDTRNALTIHRDNVPIGKIFEDGSCKFWDFDASVETIVRNLMKTQFELPEMRITFAGRLAIIVMAQGVMYGSAYRPNDDTRRFFDAVYDAFLTAHAAKNSISLVSVKPTPGAN